jgi:hypothetical protein
LPVDEGAAGAAKKGIEGEAGAAKKGVKGVIETITEAIGGGGTEEMHPPKFKALEDSASKCVVTGNDCLRHCYGMFSMKDSHGKPSSAKPTSEHGRAVWGWSANLPNG